MKLRRRAVLKWSGAGLCAVIFAAWVASRWFGLEARHVRGTSRLQAEMGKGGVTLAWSDWTSPRIAAPDGWHVGCGSQFIPQWWLAPNWMFEFSGPNRAAIVYVPFYVPLALLAIPTVVFFHRDRRNVRWAKVGCCAKCGYSLSGLPSGAACPECGRATP